MNKVVKLVGVVGLGGGLMYLFDPDRGRRRRAFLRNKAEHFGRIATDAAGKTRRDVRNHLLGVVAELESPFKAGEVADDVLEARVRSKLGRVVSHPHAIAVKAVDGVVSLSGPILTSEEHPLLDCVIEIRGVKNIDNELALYETADHISALQGGRTRQWPRFGFQKMSWSPTTRLVPTAAGSALAFLWSEASGCRRICDE